MARYHHNLEPSAFRRGEYVAWDANGHKYHVKRDGPRGRNGSWWVYGLEPDCLPVFYAGTLALVSLRLERMSAICAMPRLEHEKE